MRKLIKILSIPSAIVLVICIGLLVFTHLSTPQPSPDGGTWQGYLLYKASRELKKGMSKEEVRNVVGEPDFGGGTHWIWEAPKGTNIYPHGQYKLNVIYSNDLVSDFHIGWYEAIYD
jgi:hypothetical protein